MSEVTDLKALAAMRRYYRWKRDLVRPHLGRRIVEVGCGIGTFLALLDWCDLRIGVETDPECVAEARRRLAGLPGTEVRLLDVCTPEFEGLSPAVPDTVIFMSSLEEIADDAGALKRAAAVLAPGGRVVVFASALPGLSGALDRVYDQRRYEREGLERLLASAGFRGIRVRYANLLGALGWWWDSRFRKRNAGPAGSYRRRDLLVPAARLLDAISGPPVGRSLVAVGEKGPA